MITIEYGSGGGMIWVQRFLPFPRLAFPFVYRWPTYIYMYIYPPTYALVSFIPSASLSTLTL